MLKRAYVTAVRGLRAVSEKAGLLSRLEKRSAENRTARWLRSLFAIYDIEDMAALDLPWWTFDAIEETDRFLKSRQDAKVFEYGSGASTIWLARRAAFVVSIEHDEGWHAIVSEQLTPYRNVRLQLIEPDDEPTAGYISEKTGWQDRSFRRYASAIDDERTRFDLIVIDGRARAACLKHAVTRLAPGGMILFDNSNRERYRAAIDASGLSARRLYGATACLPYPDETTLVRSA